MDDYQTMILDIGTEIIMCESVSRKNLKMLIQSLITIFRFRCTIERKFRFAFFFVKTCYVNFEVPDFRNQSAKLQLLKID